ncbi:MAG: lytic transglycosylase domain-containing protein [Elusimicrobiota bacterium]
MKAWMMTAVVALSAPAAAQSAAGVSVWLQLPANEKLAASGRAQDANALIIKLLGPNADTVTFSAKDGPLIHYTAAGWSQTLGAEDRRAALTTLSADWGRALRVEEAGAPALANTGFITGMTSHLPTFGAALGLLPSSLVSGGEQSRFYDASRPSAGGADAVFGGGTSGFARLAPAASRSSFFTPRGPLDPPPLPYADVIEKAARASGLDPALLRAVVVAKSGYQADRSYAGAYGLMGISARNAKAYGYTTSQILDPEVNLKVGSDMLVDLIKMFGGDVHRALAAYQAGPAAVLSSGGIPNDRNVTDFMNAVQRALGPAARAASLPVRPNTIRAPLRDAVQKDAIELAEQGRKGRGVGQYRPLIDQVAEKSGIDPRLMEAVIMQEDPSGDPRAVSSKGALGLGQLMPKTAAALGVKDAFDPVENLRAVARHIKHLTKVFNGDAVLIAAAYNAGEGTVGRLQRVPRVPETMAYVRRVFNNYASLTDKKVDVEPYMPPARAAAPRRLPAN